MRHLNKRGRLHRNIGHRKATLRNMAKALLQYERIETTLAKAKALRSYVEPLITMAKNDPESVFARRMVFREIADNDLLKKLFTQLAPLYKGIPGGYTRIMPFRIRKGDGAETAIIELTKRTISDDKLIGAEKIKALKEEKKGADKKVKKEKKETKETKAPKAEKKIAPKKEEAAQHSVKDIDKAKKEEHFVEDVRKEKAKTEQKKLTEKGIFKRFTRKSI